MQRGRFENRAKWLSYNWRTAAGKTQTLPPDTTPQEFWDQHVKSKDDVITYYQLYHPELGEQVIKALAENIEKAKNGEHVLEEHWYKRDTAQKLFPTNQAGGHEEAGDDDKEWDFFAEIQRERQLALAPKFNQEEGGNWTAKVE